MAKQWDDMAYSEKKEREAQKREREAQKREARQRRIAKKDKNFIDWICLIFGIE